MIVKFIDNTVSASTTPTCPKCKGTIPSQDINVSNDIAFCRNCDASYSLSSLTFGPPPLDEKVDVNQPPAGAWFRQSGNSAVLGATHRSLPQAAGLLFMCLFWNGLVSFFASMALASTIKNLGLPLPAWFPIPKGGLMHGGMTVFMWLFLTPFILVGLGMLSGLLNCLAGRTEIGIQGDRGVLFTGIGRLGRRKRFSISEVKDVRIEARPWRDNNGAPHRSSQIVIQTHQKPITFGTTLTDERRRFVAAALKKLVAAQ
ncbi:MAG TPA: hypothetical protein VGR76_04545 [Candidatus Angelobacter sp.]|jgi:hypothetical protein|nr:hypothetical protein [Candidatus Angelobacter sp.]